MTGSGIFLVLFFLFVLIVIKVIVIFGLFILFLFVVVRNRIDLDGMNLYHFHFRFTLGTGQDFAFLDFVLVHIHFRTAFWTPHHGENLLGNPGAPLPHAGNFSRGLVMARDRRKPARATRPARNWDRLIAGVLYNASRAGRKAPIISMTSKREYPEYPRVGVGGVVIHEDRALLIRRGNAPLKGEWSIPGGMLEVGETLEQGVARELGEETGLVVAVVDLIEVFERIFPGPPSGDGTPANPARPQFHFVILDYLCEMRGGTLAAGTDAVDLAWTREEELAEFDLTAAATRVIKKAFAMARARVQTKGLQ